MMITKTNNKKKTEMVVLSEKELVLIKIDDPLTISVT